MKSLKRSGLVLNLLCILICSCSMNPSIVSPNKVTTEGLDFQKRGHIINGQTEFPETNFSVKATINDIAPQATVSLIYPPDHPTNANKTIATGLTDSNGAFTINPSISFAPATGDTFVLEAAKRIGSTGNNLMSIRTYLKRNGTNWDSMTTPGIYINNKTTALALIAGMNPTTVTANSTIGSMNVSGGISNPNNVGTAPNIITAQTILGVSDLVSKTLGNNDDPFANIKYDSVNNKYSIDKNALVGKIIQYANCSDCSLPYTDFSYVNLSEQNFFQISLSGKNFARARYSVLANILN